MEKTRDKDVNQLNSFLRGELSAVETYDQCLEKIQNPQLGTTLRELRQSHKDRARLLERKVSELGGQPARSSGPWGGFTKMLEGGAKALGDQAAIAVLEEGEDHGRNDYKRDLDDLSADVQAFVRGTLIPEQQRTHDTLSRIKKQMKH